MLCWGEIVLTAQRELVQSPADSGAETVTQWMQKGQNQPLISRCVDNERAAWWMKMRAMLAEG